MNLYKLISGKYFLGQYLKLMCQIQKKYLTKINQQLHHVLSLSKILKPKLTMPSKSTLINQKISQEMNDIHNTLLHIQTLIPLSYEDKYSNSKNSDNFSALTLHKIFGFTSDSVCKISQTFDFPTYSSSQNQKDINSKRGHYRSYTLAQKQAVLSLHIQGCSFASISRKFNIPQKNIVRWCKHGAHRRIGAGRKVNDVAMEEKLIRWIQARFQQGDNISKSQIRTVARQFSNKQDFKSSKGWLKNFVSRYKLSSTYCME